MLELILIQTYVLAAGTLAFVISRLAIASRHRFKPRKIQIKDDNLHSVSICIPARNETNAMTECLESVLASDYPKMEVIVLDDHSSDNTSHLIKAFAHAGVRFIEGRPRPEGWLGKNYALESLLDEASGHFVLFMDVDTRLSPGTIRSLVEQMKRNQLKMLSVVPQRFDTFRASAWLSSLRYFWELLFDSKSAPGSSSAAWIIERRTLSDDLGGFAHWRADVQPELYIARELAKTSEHQLVISTPALGVSYAKKWSSQVETSRRLLLPRFGNSISKLLLAIAVLGLVILPQILAIVAVVFGEWTWFVAEIILVIMTMVATGFYCSLVWRDRWWIGFLIAPIIIWQEVFLMISSAIGYRRGTISWKGRLVERPEKTRRIS